MPATAPPGIFKAYDVRGLRGEEIDGDVAELIGRAFARVLAELAGKPTTRCASASGATCASARPSSPPATATGLVAEGVHVLDAGMVGTEMLYFLVGSRGLDGGLMCTASHNPKAYTGAKLVREGALALSGDAGIGEVGALVAEGLPARRAGRRHRSRRSTSRPPSARGAPFVDPAGCARSRSCWTAATGWPGRRSARCSTGCPGSSSSPATGRRTATSPTTSRTRCWRRTAASYRRRCVAEGADLGIAWDGDADRCFFIDEHGRFADGDFPCALLARQVLATHPGAEILYDVRASRAVADTVRAAGGRPRGQPRRARLLQGAACTTQGGAFGGEVSGHYYFADFYSADSGTLPALLMLELLGRTGRTLGELLAPYRARYFISGEINSEVADPEAKLAEIARPLRRRASSRELDGISVDYADWHFNVRASNTEPLLRLCLESLVSPEHMAARRDEVLGVIRS